MLCQTVNIYHDAFGEVVEDGGLEREHLPSDHRVRQREADEERLEGGEAGVGRHAEARGGDAESSGGPLGDGVGHRLLHVHGPAVSARTDKQDADVKQV